jgi:formate hydrogenlyase transcriptional activator
MSINLGKSLAYPASEMDLRQAESAMGGMDSVAAIASLGSLDALTQIQALRVWFHPPQERSSRLQVLMDELLAEYRTSMDFPLDDTITNWVWQHQRPLIIAAEAETRFPDFARLLLEWGIKYFCAIPLGLANRRLGILGLSGTRRDAFSGFDFSSVQPGAARHQPRINECPHGEVFCLKEGGSSEDSFEGIIGRSAAIRALRQQIKTVAPTDSTVLLLGETGTGKELIAKAIHNLSSRRKGPFIKVNCAAIPAGLIESELFGHERGAFTGAIKCRMGRFEMAHGGTLLLDEIGDIPLDLQAKLLRVLQEQEFERVGGTQTTRVNVRIIAATSRDLPQMITTREFRADLYYRLNIFPMHVPALRERPEDISLLVHHFVELYAERTNRRVTDVPVEAMETFFNYPWPGNVRELQNVVERSVILSPGKVLRPPLDELKASATEPAAVGMEKPPRTATMKDTQRQLILQTLAETNWIVGGPKGAATRLGLQRTTLISKMQSLGISRNEDRKLCACVA